MLGGPAVGHPDPGTEVIDEHGGGLAGQRRGDPVPVPGGGYLGGEPGSDLVQQWLAVGDQQAARAIVPVILARRGQAPGAALRAVPGDLNAEIVDGAQGIRELIIFRQVPADRTVFLDRGQVAAAGTHDELLAASPAHAELVARQLAATPGQ